MKQSEVIKLAQWFSDSNLSRLVWRNENSSLELEKEQGFKTCEKEDLKRGPAKKVEEEEPRVKTEETGYILRSPVVGTFYAAASPTDKPFVQVGQKVLKGETLCIIEAMKLLNEISSPVDGIIKRIYPQNESMVEFGSELMEIEVS